MTEKSVRSRSIVLGGAGFLGSHLCDKLLSLGHDVTAFDDLSTGQEKNLGVSRAFGPERFEFVRGDVRSSGWSSILGQWKPSFVFNLACPASPPAYQKDPIKTMMTCVLGTNMALELAQQHGAVMVQASTSEVYGDPLVHPQHEGYWGNVNSHGPRACYDEGKRAAEALCFDYRRKLGVDVRIARIFNTYGERLRADDGRVVSNFIVQALKGEPLTIYGHGNTTRSFCYVSDLIDGFIKLAEHPNNPGIELPINLGNPTEYTLNELAANILDLTEGPEWRSSNVSRIKNVGVPIDDPCRRRPNIMRARVELGFEPKVSLRPGLKRTIEYFRGEL